MSDESKLGAQQLSSAKYLAAAQAAEAEAVRATAVKSADMVPAAEGRGTTASPECMYRWINIGVAAVLLAIAGVWYWHHQSTVKSTAETFRKRTGNPLDIALWVSGSEHTVDDMVAEMQRKGQVQLPQPGPITTQIDLSRHWQNHNLNVRNNDLFRGGSGS